jgi:gliding motility-associated-like protein
MKRFLIIIFLFPITLIGQNCDTIFPPRSADTIIYCSTNETCFEYCDGSLVINVIGTNQPYSYSWTINGATSPFLAGDNSRDSLCPGTYIVAIKDVFGDPVDLSQETTIGGPPNFNVFENSVQNPSCHDGSDGIIDLTVTGATFPYNFLWSDGTNLLDRSNLDTGLYILTITDDNNCERIDTFILNNPVEITSMTFSDTLSCIGFCDGIGIVTPSDGVMPYTFEWDNGGTDSIDSNLCYGESTVIITDANGCKDTNVVNISNPDTLMINNINIDNPCFQTCDGQLSVTIVGGQPPFSAEWSFEGSIFNTTSLTTNNDLCVGDYQLVFSDASNCIDTVLIPLIERDSFLISSSVINDSCFNSCTGQISVELLNKQNPPFIYSWSNGGNDTIISNLCSDSISLEIIDFRLCRDTFEFFIEQGDSMYFDSIVILNNTCFGDENGAISIINLSGGVLPLIYSWSDGQITTASGISTLPSSIYSVNIKDALGCSIDATNIIVNQPDSIFVANSALEDVTCFGASDGMIDVDIFGGNGTYFISWDILIPDTNYLDSLSAGEYIYTIVDTSTTCPPIIDTLVIQEPDILTISDSVVDVLCNGENTGVIYLSVTGGIPPYQYSIDSGVTFQEQNYFENLSFGTYSIIVKDLNNCFLTSPVYNINEPSSNLISSLTSPTLLCSIDTGTIILTVSGGIPSYSFIWDNGIITQNLNGASVGNYSVTISDANSCDTTISILVTSPALLFSNIDEVDLDCFEDNSGAIDLTVGGGVAPFTYVWNGPGGPYNTQDLDMLESGTYDYIIFDANLCEESGSVTVEEPNILQVFLDKTNVDCFGNSTGEINTSVSGGTSPFIYNWSNLTSNENLTNIPSGVYSVTVTDRNNCMISDSVSISEPSDILFSINTTDLLCNGESTGQIIINTLGGTPGYSFSVDNQASYQIENNFSNLQADNYSLWIKDENECKRDTVVVLSQPIGYSSLVDIQNVEVCSGDATGIINFSLIGNTPPYFYSWSNNESTDSIFNLISGTYDLTVSDVNNCQMSYSYLVTEPQAMELFYDIQLASCEEKDDGAIITIVTGGSLPISYQWGTGDTTSSISDLSKGFYSLYVEDSEGCSLPTEIIDVGFDGFNGCIEIPSGFTPNNDNIHDEWVIYGLVDFSDVVVKVYNRWGQEVFSSSGYNQPWDGKYNGVDLPTASYYYIIELNESDKVFNGTVTIKR